MEEMDSLARDGQLGLRNEVENLFNIIIIEIGRREG
jgi:hypothetical protein